MEKFIFRFKKRISCDPAFDKEILMTMLRAEDTMRDYLLGKRQDILGIQNHMFFFDRIKSINKYDFDKNPSIAMHRSITSYSAYNGKTSFTVSNLMGILIVTFYSMDEKEKMGKYTDYEWQRNNYCAESKIESGRK